MKVIDWLKIKVIFLALFVAVQLFAIATPSFADMPDIHSFDDAAGNVSTCPSCTFRREEKETMFFLGQSSCGFTYNPVHIFLDSVCVIDVCVPWGPCVAPVPVPNTTPPVLGCPAGCWKMGPGRANEGHTHHYDCVFTGGVNHACSSIDFNQTPGNSESCVRDDTCCSLTLDNANAEVDRLTQLIADLNISQADVQQLVDDADFDVQQALMTYQIELDVVEDPVTGLAKQVSDQSAILAAAQDALDTLDDARPGCWQKTFSPYINVESPHEHWMPLALHDSTGIGIEGVSTAVELAGINVGEYGYIRPDGTPEQIDKEWTFDKSNIYKLTPTPPDFEIKHRALRGVKLNNQLCLKLFIEEYAHRADCGDVILTNSAGVDEGHCQWAAQYTEDDGGPQIPLISSLFMRAQPMRSEQYDFTNFNNAGWIAINPDNTGPLGADICQKTLRDDGKEFDGLSGATNWELDFSKRGCPSASPNESWPAYFEKCLNKYGADLINSNTKVEIKLLGIDTGLELDVPAWLTTDAYNPLSFYTIIPPLPWVALGYPAMKYGVGDVLARSAWPLTTGGPPVFPNPRFIIAIPVVNPSPPVVGPPIIVYGGVPVVDWSGFSPSPGDLVASLVTMSQTDWIDYSLPARDCFSLISDFWGQTMDIVPEDIQNLIATFPPEVIPPAVGIPKIGGFDFQLGKKLYQNIPNPFPLIEDAATLLDPTDPGYAAYPVSSHWCEFQVPYNPFHMGVANKIFLQLPILSHIRINDVAPTADMQLEVYKIERIRNGCGAFNHRGNWTEDKWGHLADFLVGEIPMRNNNLNAFTDINDPIGSEILAANAVPFTGALDNAVTDRLTARCKNWKGFYNKKYRNPNILTWRLPRFDYEFLKSFIECTGPVREEGFRACNTLFTKYPGGWAGYNTYVETYFVLACEWDNIGGLATSVSGAITDYSNNNYIGSGMKVYQAYKYYGAWMDCSELKTEPMTSGPSYNRACFAANVEAALTYAWPQLNYWAALVTGLKGDDCTGPTDYIWENYGAFGFWCRCPRDVKMTTRCNESFCTCEQKVLIGGTISSNSLAICADYGPYRRWLQCFYQARAKACPVLTRDVSHNITRSVFSDSGAYADLTDNSVAPTDAQKANLPASAEGQTDDICANSTIAASLSPRSLRWTSEEANILAKLPVINSTPDGYKHHDLVFQSQARTIEAPYMEALVPYPLEVAFYTNTGVTDVFGNDLAIPRTIADTPEVFTTSTTIDLDGITDNLDAVRYAYQSYNQGVRAVSRAFWRHEYSVPTDINPRAQDAIVGPRGCNIGGWYEMMLYQARCIKHFGLNCLCDYNKTFASGNAEAYVLQMSGMVFNYVEPIELPGPDGILVDDSNTIINEEMDNRWDLIEGQKVWPLMHRGHVGTINPLPPGVDTEGYAAYYDNSGSLKNSTAYLTGLDNAEVGDFMILDETILNDNNEDARQRRHIALIERVVPNKYIAVSEWNYGKNLDSCGNTDRWGVRTRRFIYKNRADAETDAYLNSAQDEEFGIAPFCDNADMRDCYEPHWNNIKLYRMGNDIPLSSDLDHPRPICNITDPAFPKVLSNATIPATVPAMSTASTTSTSNIISSGLWQRFAVGWYVKKDVDDFFSGKGQMFGRCEPPLRLRNNTWNY